MPPRWPVICIIVANILANSLNVDCNGEVNRSQLLIVGAGVSGLAAASRLMEKGFRDFRILEAENRIGGRVNSVPFGEGVMVDLGGHWVHGGPGNPVYELAAPLGLLEDSGDNYEFVTIFSDGQALPRPISFSDPDVNPYMADFEKLHNVSFKEVLINRTRATVAKALDPGKVEAYLDFLARLQCSPEGCDYLEDVSARLSPEYRVLNSSQAFGWKGNGYRSIIDLLLRRHPKSQGPPLELGNRLLLNTEVKKIKVLDSGEVAVECTDGSVHHADLVLVTVSAGVLKHNMDSLFQPPLPPLKRSAIKATGFGTVDKIIIRFPRAWWPVNCPGFQFIWLQNDKDAYQGEHSWETEILYFATERWSPFSLTGKLVGVPARQMERTPLDGVKRAAMRILRYFLGANYSIPEPVEIIRSTWGTNPHFRGVYSYRRIEAEIHNVSHLATPILNIDGKEVVFFAGEATHPHFYSTVHGALESGWREAERILARINSASSQPTGL